tara:strand:+ start:162 stop:635 length:474 start_codon:yes stop_codon:yes gene_type:complete
MSKSKEQSAQTQKANDAKAVALAIANLDMTKLEMSAGSGRKGGSYKGLAFNILNVDHFVAFLPVMPPQLSLTMVEVVARMKVGKPVDFNSINNWWIKESGHYDQSGVNGYKQDLFQFMPHYYKARSGATRNLLDKIDNTTGKPFPKDVVNCISFVQA